MSVPAGKYRIIPTDVYHGAIEMLKKHDRVSNFTMENGVLMEQLDTKKAECIPFSDLKDQTPPEFAEYSVGDGAASLAESLVASGLKQKDARGFANGVYAYMAPWVILPPRIMEKIPGQIKGDRVFLEPGTLDKVDAFVKWFEDMSVDDTPAPKPEPELDEKTKAHRAVYAAKGKAFAEKFFLFQDDTYEGWFNLVKGKPGQMHTKKFSHYKEPIVFRISPEGCMYASSPEFKEEKEVVSSTLAQRYFPEDLRGYGYGDGPSALYRGLQQRGIDEVNAIDITKQLYSVIPKSVILPEAGMDAMVASLSNGVLLTDATMLNKAIDMYEFLKQT